MIGVCQEKQKSKVNVVGMRYLRNVCVKTHMDRVSNEWVLQECQNSDEEEDLGGSSSETEDYLEVRESNSESDQSADESEGSTEGTDDDLHIFMGRDGHSLWINKLYRQAARVTARNIIPPMHAPGVLNLAKQLNQLRKRVDELSRRAQQLANLLREAGITIPNVLPDTDEVIPKWDNKTQNASVLHEKAKKRKQRNKRRGAEPIVSSTSGFNNLVDLGYLTMPPGVGSPMLTDDGMYLNHTTNFLPVSQSGTSSMYPSASSNTHGTFYSPPRPPSCATTHLSVSRTLQQSTASPNAANSSGTTLANFNLSTIFPEIIDKQSSSVPSSVYSSNSKNPLPSTHSNSPHSSALEMPRENEFLHHSRVQPVTLSNSLGQAVSQGGRKQWS
uniref:Uncharacterized protein n=1 Tax=Timema cristinae TaxID=61476 RepID=A0A7R9CUK5_TIMCR|nr:unnamed protein product [Timema cristinae]